MQYFTALMFLIATASASMIAWSLSKESAISKNLTLTIIMSFTFWYCMPGIYFLMGSVANTEDSFLYSSYFDINKSVLFSIICYILLLAVPFFFRYLKNRDEFFLKVSQTRLNLFIFLTLISALLHFYLTLREFGYDFILRVIIGLSSAREVMSFENYSSGHYQSLLALWDIVNVFIGISLASTIVLERKTLSLSFVFIVLIVILSFISSGTRSILLLLIFSIVVSMFCRPGGVSKKKAKNTKINFNRIIILILVSCLLYVSISTINARFEDKNTKNAILIQNISENNDMLRELVFVFAGDGDFDADPIAYIATPFAFLMPRFLGFDKKTPTHLVNFNRERAGIDLVDGAGNVFPGIIADMYMCFSYFGILILALFTYAYLFISYRVTVAVRNSTFNYGLFIALQSYYFISFRNIQGSLALLVIAAFILSFYLGSGKSKS